MNESPIEQMKARLADMAKAPSVSRGAEESEAQREARLMDDDSIWDSFGNRTNILPNSGGSIR